MMEMAKRARTFFQALTDFLDDFVRGKDQREGREPREPREAREPREPREAKEPRERKRARPRKSKSDVATDGRRRGGRRKVARDANAPKKPLTAFMLYCGNRQKQMREANQSELTVLSGRARAEREAEAHRRRVELPRCG